MRDAQASVSGGRACGCLVTRLRYTHAVADNIDCGRGGSKVVYIDFETVYLAATHLELYTVHVQPSAARRVAGGG